MALATGAGYFGVALPISVAVLSKAPVALSDLSAAGRTQQVETVHPKTVPAAKPAVRPNVQPIAAPLIQPTPKPHPPSPKPKPPVHQGCTYVQLNVSPGTNVATLWGRELFVQGVSCPGTPTFRFSYRSASVPGQPWIVVPGGDYSVRTSVGWDANPGPYDLKLEVRDLGSTAAYEADSIIYMYFIVKYCGAGGSC